MPPIIIPNAAIMDGSADRAAHPVDALLADGRIVEVGEPVNAPPGAHVLDAAGRFVMPCPIDCYAHVVAATAWAIFGAVMTVCCKSCKTRP
ncbi:hypothetical protein [Rhizobium mayense]|uniref:Amidohydrolase family protein n=1 Tax=Rhizobium mayense TaxID=1312184 RepID=A0ABT7K1L0_9HYPH|nr:hypothetical protein [Rhizobium mayense]MDL2402401.1 hypothetical protein [Rhizobium mayense]